MAAITLEFDNTLEKSEIIVQLLSPDINEMGEGEITHNLTDKAQTMVMGIHTPLIMINNTVIDIGMVKYFSLSSEGNLPSLSLTVIDRLEIINNIDKPGQDNEVRVQILPRFDNAYKKIDLTFFITNIEVNGSVIDLSCIYKVPSILSSQFKAFGKIDTYSLFREIAYTNKLGFATNISKLDDYRYVYCNNKSLIDLMNSEISYANASEHILTWWIDLWDNINLVDIKERYYAVDPKSELQVWIAGQVNEMNSGVEIEALQTEATITNFPGISESELSAKTYTSTVKPGINVSAGTDKVYCIFEDNIGDSKDYFLQNSDVKNDIFTKFEYLGENYGDYNYILAKHIRESFLQKMGSEYITVGLQSPLLGLMRGHKVNFIRYTTNEALENKIKALENAGIANRNIESNIPLSDYEIQYDEEYMGGKFTVDRTVSGQYLIKGVNIEFIKGRWNYELVLVKPIASKVSILPNK